MTPAEAQTLLGIAASFDNRKPSEEAAIAWSHALAGLRFVDCRDAVVAHYRASSEWLMPQRVISEVKRIRSKRIAEAGDPTPPPDLTPLETIAWLAETRRRIGDGEPVDWLAAYGELTPRHMPDLLRALPSPDNEARMTTRTDAETTTTEEHERDD